MSRPVGRVLVAHASGAVAMGVAWPVLLVAAERAGAVGLALGLVAATRLLPYVALSWLAGRLADRRERASVVRATLVCRALALLACAVALGVGWVWAAVAAAVLAVAVGTPAYPAIAAAMPSLAGERSAPATRVLVTIEVSSFVVGPAVGGLLVLAPAPTAPLSGVALALAGLALVRGIRMPAPTRTDPSAPATPGRVLLRGNTIARRALGNLVAVNVVVGGLGTVLLPLSQAWGMGEEGFGLATAALGLASLAAPLLGRLVTGQSSALGVLGVAVVVVAVAGWPAALLGLVVVGMLAVRAESAATEALQASVPDDRRAAAFGLGDSVMVAAALVSSAAGPGLAELIGAPGAVLVGAATVLLAAVLGVRRHTAGRRPEHVGSDAPADRSAGPPLRPRR